MKTVRRFFARTLGLLRRRTQEREMAEEMRLHLELQTERNVAAGMSEAEARFAARRQFGGVEQVKERCREQRGWPWLDELGRDLRFAARMLGKHPGFTFAAVLTLALGTGLVTTLFTMINGVMLKQLPFDEPRRIVSIDAPAALFDDLVRQQQSCESLAFVQPVEASVRAEAFASRVRAAVVSDNFLAVLRAEPALGRGFLPEDGAAGAARTVLIGYDLWQREYAGAPDVCGRELRVGGDRRTITGVMPAGFAFPFNQELWIPRRADEPVTGGIVFGRLQVDVNVRQASEQFGALARAPGRPKAADFVWDADQAVADGARPVAVVPFAERTVKDALRLMLLAILAATLLVLLLACANVANLVLARAVDRRRELAVRAAIGASRARLIRQMLTESLAVALLGAGGGLVIASWTTWLLWNYMMKERPLTGGAPFWMNFAVDGRVFAFVTGIALLASVLTGLVPALQASRVDLGDALKDGAGGSLRVSRFSGALMNVQLAFSVCLVTVAGLFVGILVAFNHKTLPFDPRTVLTARVALDGRSYDDAGARQRFFAQLAERLAAVPGVQGVGWNSSESLRSASTLRIELEGETYGAAGAPESVMEVVSADFLDSYGVGLWRGRTFTAADTAAAPAVALVNAEFADQLSPGRSAVGRRFRIADTAESPGRWITIVGVTPDLGSVKAGRATRGPVFYRPLAQQEETRAMTLLVRGAGDVRRFGSTIRREVAALDPDLPVGRIQTVEEIIEMERIGMNAFGWLFVVCGAGALVLASVGVYGVISLAVRLRTREFGVRMALGADRSMILRMVLHQGARQMIAGLGAGAMLALAAAVVLRATFAGLGHAEDAGWICAGVLAVLAVVAGAALFVPARRAARVDPMEALRCE